MANDIDFGCSVDENSKYELVGIIGSKRNLSNSDVAPGKTKNSNVVITESDFTTLGAKSIKIYVGNYSNFLISGTSGYEYIRIGFYSKSRSDNYKIIKEPDIFNLSTSYSSDYIFEDDYFQYKFTYNPDGSVDITALNITEEEQKFDPAALIFCYK